jgi:uncharacterized protein YndB with AHSA1/START domain
VAEVSVTVDVEASPEAVWAAAVDWDRQGEWMALTRVSGGHGRGATLTAFTGIGRLGFDDPMTITAWEPPYRCVVRHDGDVVRGTAAFEVVPTERGARFVWTEWLVLPFGLAGELGFAVVKPLVLWPLRRSMRRFAAMVSSRGTPASPSPGTT